MIRQKSFLKEDASLYLVSTPIGNLKDITIRAIETLKMCDIIYCEDTRVSVNLLKEYGIEKPLKSYHEFNKDGKNREILDSLKNQMRIALISDAGTPVISDPGFELVKLVKKEGFSVISIPGVTAFTTALTSSGMPVKPFLYYGFLSEQKSKRRKELEELREFVCTIVFYESPHRIKETLKDIFDLFGDISICLCRELTKKFEEILTGTTSEILEIVDELKGEMVLLCKREKEIKDFSHLKIDEHVRLYLKDGMKVNEAIKIVAKERKMAKQEVYKIYHSNEENNL